MTVFNIGGNKARLIAAIHYNRRKIYIRAVFTHEEYNRRKVERVIMSAMNIQHTINVWHPVSQFLYIPHTEKEYNNIVELLDGLIDEVGENENHPLASLMEILGVLIEKYEYEHIAEISEV